MGKKKEKDKETKKNEQSLQYIQSTSDRNNTNRKSIELRQETTLLQNCALTPHSLFQPLHRFHARRRNFSSKLKQNHDSISIMQCSTYLQYISIKFDSDSALKTQVTKDSNDCIFSLFKIIHSPTQKSITCINKQKSQCLSGHEQKSNFVSI